MRIVAGKYGSRPIKSLSGDNTRPTADKVKGAIFSRIGPYFDGGSVLDLFSGSGNVGLEALSRGMDQAIFCDHHPQAIQIIKENIKTLQVEDESTVWKGDYLQLLKRCHDEQRQFDLIFLDPPYALSNKADLLNMIDAYDLLTDAGDLVFETDKKEILPEVIHHFKQIKSTEYGITRITYYIKEVNL